MKDPTNVTAQSKDMSDDYTEFNGDFATRIDGKMMNSRLAEGVAKDSSKGSAAEMLNEKVQVYNGDVAILTYNYAGTTIDVKSWSNGYHRLSCESRPLALSTFARDRSRQRAASARDRAAASSPRQRKPSEAVTARALAWLRFRPWFELDWIIQSSLR